MGVSGSGVSAHEVVIAGGGPTGLMLAAELAVAGVDVVVVERRATQHVDGSRAGGLHSRTLEVLDQRGVADRFLAAGETHPHVGFAMTFLDVSDFPTRHNYLLALWQSEFERILAAWVVDELRVPIIRSNEVTGFEQHDDVVDIQLAHGPALRAQYLIGCDGGRSTVRKAAAIDFAGSPATTSWMIAEVEFDGEPELGFRRDGLGQHAIGRRQPHEPHRLVLTERSVDHTDEPTMADLRDALMGVYGTDFGLRRATWISRFTDVTRQATSYRVGRVLLAGDAAHVHPPQGGQGLNVGVQDAVNLGWKLAQVVQQASPDSLLDTYHAERHPVGARVLHNTRAQVALGLPDDRHEALRETMYALLAMDEPRKHVAAMISGLDVHYDLGGGHPLVGRRMPDLDLRTAEGTTRVFALLRDARPVLLDLSERADVDIAPRSPRVRLVRASCDGPWELPALGRVDAPNAVLMRPDGHVAFAGDPAGPQLPAAMSAWFGTPF